MCQHQVLQLQAAEGDGHQGVSAQATAAAHVHALQVRVLADDWQQLPVRDPVGAGLDGKVLQNLVVAQDGAEGLLGDLGADL